MEHSLLDKVVTHLQDIKLLLLDIKKQNAFSKEVLTAEEAAQYLGISVHTLNHYKSDNLIGYYKPNRKRDYFNKSDLDQFALQHKIKPLHELEKEALSYIKRVEE